MRGWQPDSGALVHVRVRPSPVAVSSSVRTPAPVDRRPWPPRRTRRPGGRCARPPRRGAEMLPREPVEAGEEETRDRFRGLGERLPGALGRLGHQSRRHLGHPPVVALEGLVQGGGAEREVGQLREELMAGGLLTHRAPQGGGQGAGRLLESGVGRSGPLDLCDQILRELLHHGAVQPFLRAEGVVHRGLGHPQLGGDGTGTPGCDSFPRHEADGRFDQLRAALGRGNVSHDRIILTEFYEQVVRTSRTSRRRMPCWCGR